MAHQSVIGAYRGVIGIGFVARTVSYAVGYRRRSTADKAGYFPINAEAVGNWFVFHGLHLVYGRKP